VAGSLVHRTSESKAIKSETKVERAYEKLLNEKLLRTVFCLCSTRAKKYFLVLMAGPPSVNTALPKAEGMDGESESEEEDSEAEDGTIENADRQRQAKRRRKESKHGMVGRTWQTPNCDEIRLRGAV
jgi:hypothetical protein